MNGEAVICMRAFISWSDRIGREIANIFKREFEMINPHISFYVADRDNQTEWKKALDEARLGILCVTEENQANQWFLYEAGALSRSTVFHPEGGAESIPRVFPILIPNNVLKKTPVVPEPVKKTMKSYQFYSQDDMKELAVEMNRLCVYYDYYQEGIIYQNYDEIRNPGFLSKAGVESIFRERYDALTEAVSRKVFQRTNSDNKLAALVHQLRQDFNAIVRDYELNKSDYESFAFSDDIAYIPHLQAPGNVLCKKLSSDNYNDDEKREAVHDFVENYIVIFRWEQYQRHFESDNLRKSLMGKLYEHILEINKRLDEIAQALRSAENGNA